MSELEPNRPTPPPGDASHKAEAAKFQYANGGAPAALDNRPLMGASGAEGEAAFRLSAKAGTALASLTGQPGVSEQDPAREPAARAPASQSSQIAAAAAFKIEEDAKIAAESLTGQPGVSHGAATAAPAKDASLPQFKPVQTEAPAAVSLAGVAEVALDAPAARPAPKAQKPSGPNAASEAAPKTPPLPDFEQLSRNLAHFVEQGGKALAAMMKPMDGGKPGTAFGAQNDLSEVFTSLGRVAEYYAKDARRALEAQTALSTQFIALWGATLKKLSGEKAPDIAAPAPSDKRFADPEWRENPYFDFLKQAYVLTSRWADDLVQRADEMDPRARDKAAFYLKQVTSALSPSNFLPTNPELLRATMAESGANLARGMQMMAEDIEAGGGQLRIRQADTAKFTLGVNLAATPGKVIFRNELIELIQYAPSTPTVYKRPLLIVPPWINKFYVLDLNPEKSFVRWAVAQGLTVFVISWVNPDERHVDKGFEAYIREGVFAALDAVEAATGERDVSAIGYCVGGTLLAVSLAFMAELGDKRISSATFFAAQVDFKDPGDLKLFVDAEQLKSIERRMADTGYLDGAQMANAFNMLRPNDLIWSYWVNNYLKGKEPMAFDLLVWNSDATRMPAANHRFYLRHCYLQNDLTNDRMEIEGRPISLGKVKIPIYDLAAREDHIAPARSVFNGAKYFGGPVRYVMSGSGHIAGVVNPAGKPKYQYWSGGPPQGEFEDWVAAAKETAGSWWVDWIAWITEQAPERIPAREPGGSKLAAICDAPGEYVRAKA